MSVDQIRDALDAIDATPRAGFLDELERDLVARWSDDEPGAIDVPTDDGELALDMRRTRRRWILAAAAGTIALAIGFLAVAAVQDPDSVQTDTVPPTPAPTTNPAPQPAPVIDSTLPIDSSPATGPSTTVNSALATPTTAPSAGEGSVIRAAPFTTPALFTEITPGSMIDLPKAPIADRIWGATVWTGTEMIVWGGTAYDPVTGDATPFGDGAAFNLANGTWRIIAPAPLAAREQFPAVWTGTEMVVWGGQVVEHADVEGVPIHDGAAYNPTTDSWRMLPAAPLGSGTPQGRIVTLVWTGTEVVLSGGSVTAAYDPATDTWRRLADRQVFALAPIWTGQSIVWDAGDTLTRYDATADGWTAVGNPYAAVVGVPDADGIISNFVALPKELGAPTQILNDVLEPIGELPAFPGDPSIFTNGSVDASVKWVGEEAIFWIWNGRFPYEPDDLWALNPTTQTWRRLAVAADPEFVESGVVAGDVIMSGGTDGFAYRSVSP
jgi:hypothetical protein